MIVLGNSNRRVCSSFQSVLFPFHRLELNNGSQPFDQSITSEVYPKRQLNSQRSVNIDGNILAVQLGNVK